MGRIKTVKDYDTQIAALQKRVSSLKAGRQVLVDKAKSVVGEIFMDVCPEIPTDKVSCREYAVNVMKLIEAHPEEFQAMFHTVPSEPAADEPAEADVLPEESFSEEGTEAGAVEP